MKRFSRVLSLILCMALLAGLLSTTAFASRKKTVKIVGLGDSTSMGYLMDDFSWDHNHEDEIASQWSNCALLKQYLEETWGLEVDAKDLTLTGSRTFELRAVLDKDFYNRLGTKPGYCNDHFKGPYGYLACAGNDLHPYQSYEEMHKVFTEAISDADIITFDICMAEITSVLGAFSMPEYLYGYSTCYELLEAEGCQFLGQSMEALRKTLDSLLNSAGLPAEQITGLVDGLLYGYASMCCHFSKSVELIYKLNPDVNLIVVGPYNAMHDVALTTGDVTIDVAPIWQVVLDALANYSICMDKNSWRYRYADCRSGIETLQDAAAKGDWEGYKNFYYMICGSYDVEPTQQVKENISAACANRTFQLESFTQVLGASGVFGGKEALTNPNASPEEKEALALSVMFGLNHSAGLHPDKIGYWQKFDAIKHALLGCAAANGTYLNRILEDGVGFVGTVVTSILGNKESNTKLQTIIKKAFTPVIRFSLFK